MSGARRLSVGSIECWLLSDGRVQYRRETLFADTAGEDRDAAVAGYLDAEGFIPSNYHCLLIRAEGRLALVDAGIGDLAGPAAGKVPESLQEAGFEADDVDLVLLSHAHADHIGGLTVERDGARAPRYGRARHRMLGGEWEFWTSSAADHLPEMLRAAVNMTFPALQSAGLIDPIADGEEVLPGVRVIAAPGHTPGHAVVSVRSGEEGLLYLGDTVLHVLDFEHPEWLSAFDVIPDATVRTRRRLLDEAARDGSAVVAFHVGYGRVRGENGAYRFEPG